MAARVTNRYYQGPPSDHFDGTRFFTPGQPATDKTLADMWRWRRTSRPCAWPKTVPVEPARPEASVHGLRVTMVGHATLLIQANGRNILTDPVWSARASPVRFAGPRRVTAPGIRFADLPRIDAVVISHCHYDHLDLATLRELVRRCDPVVAVPLGVDAIIRRALPAARLMVGDWWDRIALAPDLHTTLTPAAHWANRGLRDVRMSLWAGHWLDIGSHRLWFAGDTGYGDGQLFDGIRARLGTPDAALIPIGAYEPRWFMAAQHVDPAEAVRIFTQVAPSRALGIHWGTFRLTDEARDAPVQALAAALAAADIAGERFRAAVPGEVYDLTG